MSNLLKAHFQFNASFPKLIWPQPIKHWQKAGVKFSLRVFTVREILYCDDERFIERDRCVCVCVCVCVCLYIRMWISVCLEELTGAALLTYCQIFWPLTFRDESIADDAGESVIRESWEGESWVICMCFMLSKAECFEEPRHWLAYCRHYEQVYPSQQEHVRTGVI